MPSTRWSEAILRLLAERGWSRRQLARRAHIQPNTLTNIIKHGRHTDTETLGQIANAFGVDLSELFATSQQTAFLRTFSEHHAPVDAARLFREIETQVKDLVVRELKIQYGVDPTRTSTRPGGGVPAPPRILRVSIARTESNGTSAGRCAVVKKRAPKPRAGICSSPALRSGVGRPSRGLIGFDAMPKERPESGQSGLSREMILNAFQDMSDGLGRRSAAGELCLFGGTVMVLVFAARPSTKDVDAIFQPATIMREVAREVGEANGFPEHWLNDAVKGFVSARHETIQGGLPQFAYLRLTMPTPEYLLAMKCMASRIGAVEGEADDVSDIVVLIRHLKLKSAKDAMEIVAAYYPPDQIPIRAQYLVEGLFAEGTL